MSCLGGRARPSPLPLLVGRRYLVAEKTNLGSAAIKTGHLSINNNHQYIFARAAVSNEKTGNKKGSGIQFSCSLYTGRHNELYVMLINTSLLLSPYHLLSDGGRRKWPDIEPKGCPPEK